MYDASCSDLYCWPDIGYILYDEIWEHQTRTQTVDSSWRCVPGVTTLLLTSGMLYFYDLRLLSRFLDRTLESGCR